MENINALFIGFLEIHPRQVAPQLLRHCINFCSWLTLYDNVTGFASSCPEDTHLHQYRRTES